MSWGSRIGVSLRWVGISGPSGLRDCTRCARVCSQGLGPCYAPPAFPALRSVSVGVVVLICPPSLHRLRHPIGVDSAPASVRSSFRTSVVPSCIPRKAFVVSPRGTALRQSPSGSVVRVIRAEAYSRTPVPSRRCSRSGASLRQKVVRALGRTSDRRGRTTGEPGIGQGGDPPVQSKHVRRLCEPGARRRLDLRLVVLLESSRRRTWSRSWAQVAVMRRSGLCRAGDGRASPRFFAPPAHRGRATQR